MITMKKLNVKGLEHGEREKLIFPGIEELKVAQTLRVVMEFNPIPLVHMLKARNEFEVSYEKEGPGEWILNITRIGESVDRKSRFKELLRGLKDTQISAQAKEHAKELFQAVDATTIGILEQELIREGVTQEEIRTSLCDIHLEVLRDSLVAKRIEVSSPHPVHTLMEEHKVILENLNKLGFLVERFQAIGSFEIAGVELDELKEVAHHLVEAESHHQREEDVIFPRLERHEIVEPPSIMKTDHVEFRKRKQRLYQLAQNPEDVSFVEFKKNVIELGSYLNRELASHIFKEDNILYQVALQVFSREEWEEVKRECDKIGYCCFTPEDRRKE
jgi:DUF438 domain-containing protein